LLFRSLGSIYAGFAVGVAAFPVISPEIGFRPLHERRHASDIPKTRAAFSHRRTTR